MNNTDKTQNKSLYFDRACQGIQDFLIFSGWEYTENFLAKDPITGVEYPVVEAFIIAGRDLMREKLNK